MKRATLFMMTFLAFVSSYAQEHVRPNVLIIMADDLGYGDLSSFGAKDIKTPNIDKLMSDGLRFTDFTANSCVCSPSRAAFLTGRFQDTVGVPGVIRTNDDNSWGYLTPGVQTLPQVLQSHGYRTSLIGKWHLGLKSPNLPNDRGFEEYKGFNADMMEDYYTHIRRGENYMYHNDQPLVTSGVHATELFTQWAIEDIKNALKDGRPFFQFLAYNAPHDPIQPPVDWMERFQKNNPTASQPRIKLGALIEHLDHHVGLVLQALDQLGLSQNTLVVFTSDNGGQSAMSADNGPFREGKTHMYEGGLRICTSFTWPTVIPPNRESPFSGMLVDLFPTIIEFAGIEDNIPLDGRSLYQEIMIGNQQPFSDRLQIYTWLQGYKKHALRKGSWKLVKDSEKLSYQLFNLANDPSEKIDLSHSNPEKASELLKEMTAYLHEVEAVNCKRPSQRD
jgi:arylsulfatase A-like enzyme